MGQQKLIKPHLFFWQVKDLCSITIDPVDEPHVSLESCPGDELPATFFTLFSHLAIVYSYVVIVSISLVKLLATQLAKKPWVSQSTRHLVRITSILSFTVYHAV